MSNERWLPVVGFEGIYSVSNRGRVRSEYRIITKDNNGTITPHEWPTRLLRPSNDDGYLRVTLRRNGKTVYRRVHILMLEAFRGPRPPGYYGLHKDDVRTNNILSNLRWGTPSENSHDRVSNGRDPKANQTHCLNKHEFTPENTMLRPDRPGTRECRTCHREQGRKAAARYRQRQKAANQ